MKKLRKLAFYLAGACLVILTFEMWGGGLLIFMTIAFFMFKPAINLWNKSKAATALEMLLEKTSQFISFNRPLHGMAVNIIESAWNECPKTLAGQIGARPHKISIAGFALALEAKRLKAANDPDFQSVFMALGVLLSDVKRNQHSLQLSRADHDLLGIALTISTELADA